jgi:hypothetical protein
MQKLPSAHFQLRAREHYARISALGEQLGGPFSRSDAEVSARMIKAQLRIDRDWANSSIRVHSLDKPERTALLAICSACATLNRFKVYSNPSGWVSRVSEAAAALARYETYTEMESADAIKAG